MRLSAEQWCTSPSEGLPPSVSTKCFCIDIYILFSSEQWCTSPSEDMHKVMLHLYLNTIELWTVVHFTPLISQPNSAYSPAYSPRIVIWTNWARSGPTASFWSLEGVPLVIASRGLNHCDYKRILHIDLQILLNTLASRALNHRSYNWILHIDLPILINILASKVLNHVITSGYCTSTSKSCLICLPRTPNPCNYMVYCT